jgi:hypothetical protein
MLDRDFTRHYVFNVSLDTQSSAREDRKALLLKVALLAVALGGILIVLLMRPQTPRFRYCGHPDESFLQKSPLNIFRASHCCRSASAVNDLHEIYYAQRIYHEDHGSYATSFEQLTNEYVHRSKEYVFYLEGNSSNWSVSVPQQFTLAGSYLLMGDGKLHFSTKGALQQTIFC